jgi:D-methionine transport system ATP-binding protein
VGEAAGQPVLASLVRRFDVDVNILGGSIQSVGGQRIGRLQVKISGQQVDAALAHLNELGVHVEVN